MTCTVTCQHICKSMIYKSQDETDPVASFTIKTSISSSSLSVHMHCQYCDPDCKCCILTVTSG